MQSEPVAATEGLSAIAPGMMLRQAREARGESLAEVAQALKLSLKQLDALESGHHETLPGPAFVRGFLRNYARHVGLDPAVVLAGLSGTGTAAVDLTPLSNADGDMPVGRGVRFNLVPAAVVAGLLLVLMFAGSYFGWFETSSPPEPVAVEPFPPGEGAGSSDGTMPPVGIADPDALVPPAMNEAAQPDSATALMPQSSGLSSQAVPAAAPPAAVEAASPPGAGPAGLATDGLRFTFTVESWVEVKDGSGAILFAGLGTPGSTRTVQGKPPYALVVGNASGVRLDYQGKPIDLVPHTKVSVARLTVQ